MPTEIQKAEFQFNKIKIAVSDSLMDYCIEDTPYSAKIFLRKKYLRDLSTVSSNQFPSTPVQHSPSQTFPNLSHPTPAEQSLFSYDSGFFKIR